MLRTSRDGNCSVSRSRIADCSLYLLDNFLNEKGSNCVSPVPEEWSLVRVDGLLQPVVLSDPTTNHRFNYSTMLLKYFHVLNTHRKKSVSPQKSAKLKSVAMAALVGTRCIWNCTRVQQS